MPPFIDSSNGETFHGNVLCQYIMREKINDTSQGWHEDAFVVRRLEQ